MKKENIFKLIIALITAITFSLIEVLYYKKELTITTFLLGAILSWPILIWGKLNKPSNK